ncbi:hypothetical protein V6N11_080668 [Hibiscus sabdariffa]|uniref:Uncharacterized protein n=2 Tax=Hibiscus sabdariffa TaxID=183260 RepID=A0ABR2AHW1_9ROSI
MDLFFTEPSYLCQWRSLQGGQATQNQKILEDRSQGDEEINREKSTGRNNGMRVKVKGNNGSKVDVLNLQSMKLEASRSLVSEKVENVIHSQSGKFQETKVVERAELELESSSETEAIAVERGSRSPERNQESQGEEYDAINVIFIGKENNDRSLHESRLLRGQISDLEFMSNGLKMSKKKAMEGNKTPVEEGANKQGVVGGQDVSLKSPRRNLVEEAKNSLESEPNVLKQNKVDPDFNLENGSKRAREDLSVSGLLQEKNDCMSGGLIIRKSAWEASVDDRMNAGLGNVTPNQEVNTVVNFSSNGEGPWDYFSEIRERKNKKERKYGSLWELQRNEQAAVKELANLEEF